jgi:hypothetical protein
MSFFFTTVSRPALGPTQPPIQWEPGALSLVAKRPERESDHSPPSSAEVKNAWSYTSTPQRVFMVWCLVKHKDNFTLSSIDVVPTSNRNHPEHYPSCRHYVLQSVRKLMSEVS